MTTLRDVAKHCGVSAATVSNVLNERADRVSAETREKVLAAVRELRYKPTPANRTRQNPLSRNLAVICNELSSSPIRGNHYFGVLFDSMVEAAALQGWSTTLFVQSMWSENGFAVRSNFDGRCDGMVMVAPEADSELAKAMLGRGAPIIFLGTTTEDEAIGFVDIDNFAAGRELTEHLIGLGHRKICFFGAHTTSSKERQAGFEAAMRSAGLEASLSTRISAKTSSDDAVRFAKNDLPPQMTPSMVWARELLSDFSIEALPTAIICWNDSLARGVVRYLAWKGIQVPEEISVVGVDDLPEATDESPSLTTIRQPLNAIAKSAVNALIEHVREPHQPLPKIKFHGELVCRRSSGGVPKTRFASALSGGFHSWTNGGTK